MNGNHEQDSLNRPVRLPLRGAISTLALGAGLLIGCVGVDEDAQDDPIDSPDDGTVYSACFYESPFSGVEECREFSGDGWLAEEAASACSQLAGTEELGARCPATYTLGTCVLDDGAERATTIFIYGEDPSTCEESQTGCELFGGGRWVAAPTCSAPEPGSGGNVFIQPTLECREPLAGEPEGQSEGGQVCTWQSIAGSTEEGRRFSDYASCSTVYSQRPYYPADPAPAPATPDERLQDPDYVTELDWVKGQIEASACVCCHSTRDAANGPSNWYLEAPGNWMDSFYDTGLAMGANYVTSEAFGAYPAEHNNGFERGVRSGFPSTDPERMQAFFIAELEHRGLGLEDFGGVQPFGGPLVAQLNYQPSACESGERVERDGTVVWSGGSARYVYVLEPGGQSPTVPPNLDLPAETLWRLDVPAERTAIASGEIRYGAAPADLSQRFPEAEEPIALVPGTEYYLYVARDVAQPITRCLFTY